MPHTHDRPLRILMLSTSDTGGGAAEACRRLLEVFEQIPQVEVRMLVLNQRTDSSSIMSVARSPLLKVLGKVFFLAERAEIYLKNGRSRRNLFRVSTARFGFDVCHHPWVKWADILHLHWINQGFLSLRSLHRLARLGKPIFSTLHDLWAATGICHLPLEFGTMGRKLCSRYELGCGRCPLLMSEDEQDLSHQTLQKKRFLAQLPFRYIAVSQAEARLFEESYLMKGRMKPFVLPNPIDLSLFAPRVTTRPEYPEWYSPKVKHYLVFVAARLDDEVKGAHLLRQVCEEIKTQSPERAKELCLLLVGNIKNKETFADFPIQTLPLGAIQDRHQLITLYNLSSVVLSTSIYATQGQTLVEGLASGAAAMAFACGGPEDIVVDGVNGYLIPAFDTELYAQRLLLLLSQREAGAFSKENCQASVQSFGAKTIALQLLSLYEYALTHPTQPEAKQ